MRSGDVIIQLTVPLENAGNADLLSEAIEQRDCFKLARTIIGVKSSQEVRRLIDTRVYTGNDENSWFLNFIALDERLKRFVLAYLCCYGYRFLLISTKPKKGNRSAS